MSNITYIWEKKRMEAEKKKQKLLKDIIELLGKLDGKLDILIELIKEKKPKKD